MEKLLVDDWGALRLLMTEDLYKIAEPDIFEPVIKIQSEQKAAPSKEVAPSEEVKETAVVFSYLGENNKYFLILVDDKAHQHLNSADRETLLKILQAKGLELRDVAILNVNRHPNINFSQLKDFFVPARIVFFGLSPQQFGLPAIGANQPEKHQEVRLLSTFSFAEMQNDVNKKKAFWQVMKNF